MPPEISVLEIALRISSAISFTIAAGLIFILLYKQQLNPRPAWLHLAHTAALVALWRWVVVAIINPDLFPDIIEFLIPWIQPINQALSILTGIAIILLTVVYRKGGKYGR